MVDSGLVGPRAGLGKLGWLAVWVDMLSALRTHAVGGWRFIDLLDMARRTHDHFSNPHADLLRSLSHIPLRELAPNVERLGRFWGSPPVILALSPNSTALTSLRPRAAT